MIDKNTQASPGVLEHIVIEGRPNGPLSGLTFVAKDLFDVKGYVTGAGTPDWKRTHNVATETAPALTRLLDAGAKLIGKSISDELAFSLDGINVHYGTPLNSLYPDRIPGGSSSGSAAAVAAKVCDFALGTDTAGSVRVPAAYCGIFGFRPTHGAVDISGVVPLGKSFDAVGWFARELNILGRVGLQLLPPGDKLSPDVAKLCLIEDLFSLVVDPAIRAALRDTACNIARTIGAQIEQTELPSEFLDKCIHCFGLIRSYEAWTAHGKWITETKPNLAPIIRERFELSSTVDKEQADLAEQQRERLNREFEAIVQNRIIIAPTTSALPPLLTTGTEELHSNRLRNMQLNALASLFGLPQLAFPVQINGHTLSLSLIARRNADMSLLTTF